MNRFNRLSSSNWQTLNGLSTSVLLSKEQLITRSNEWFKKEVFVEKGVVRGFIVDDEGNDKSTAFFEEGNFMSTSSLRNDQGKSIHNYQSLGVVKLLVFDVKPLREFFSKNKLLSKIGAKIKEEEIVRMSERDRCLLQVTAKDKYAAFLKCYPTIERHISQKHIASYLGITPVSLSRVRAQLNS